MNTSADQVYSWEKKLIKVMQNFRNMHGNVPLKRHNINSMLAPQKQTVTQHYIESDPKILGKQMGF
jgi:hypothetical protein